jgi:hypothetical protein
MQNSISFVASIAVLKPPQKMTPAIKPPIMMKPKDRAPAGPQNFRQIRPIISFASDYAVSIGGGCKHGFLGL